MANTALLRLLEDPTYRKIVETVSNRPLILNRELAKVVGVSPKDTQRCLNDLIGLGLVVKYEGGPVYGRFYMRDMIFPKTALFEFYFYLEYDPAIIKMLSIIHEESRINDVSLFEKLNKVIDIRRTRFRRYVRFLLGIDLIELGTRRQRKTTTYRINTKETLELIREQKLGQEFFAESLTNLLGIKPTAVSKTGFVLFDFAGKSFSINTVPLYKHSFFYPKSEELVKGPGKLSESMWNSFMSGAGKEVLKNASIYPGILETALIDKEQDHSKKRFVARALKLLLERGFLETKRDVGQHVFFSGLLKYRAEFALLNGKNKEFVLSILYLIMKGGNISELDLISRLSQRACKPVGPIKKYLTQLKRLSLIGQRGRIFFITRKITDMNHYFESRKEVYVAQLATALSEFFKLNEQWITTKIMGNFAEFEIGKNTITLCINPVAAGGLEYNYLKHPPFVTPNKAKELFTAVDLAVVAHVSYYPGVSVENLKELIKKEENEIAEEDIEKSIDVLLELDILKKIGQEKNYSLFIPEGMVYRNIFRALYGLGNVGIIHKILIKIKEYHGALYAETLAKELDVDFSRLHPYLEALNKYQIVTINGEGPRGWVKMNLKKLLAMQDRFDDGKKDFKDYFRLKLSLLCGVPYKRVYMRGGANFTFFTVRGGKITICTNPIRAYDWLPAKGTRLWHY